MKNIIILLLLLSSSIYANNISTQIKKYNDLKKEVYKVKVSHSLKEKKEDVENLQKYRTEITQHIIKFQTIVAKQLNKKDTLTFLDTNELLVIRIVLSKTFQEIDLYTLIYLNHKHDFLVGLKV